MAEKMDASADQPTYSVVIKGDGVNIDKRLDAETVALVIELVVGGPSAGARSASSSRSTRPKKAKRAAPRKARRRKTSPGIAKDLSLRPSGKPSFVDFAAEKKPGNHYEKQAVIVAWLTDSASMDSGITPDHINTCYQGAGWKRPARFEGNLQLTASRKGWFDTTDMDDIKITVAGEDYVKHDLPRPDKT